MSKVGIIANPASGKDIRRLVSYATVISNTEKTDIVKRVILGLDSTGVDEIVIMPDYYGLGMRALEALNHHHLSSKIAILDLEIQGNQEDSIRAAQMMKENQVDCIITLGGDGTNRVVSKTCGWVPLIPISTGTNNVFPVMTEGTAAGMAAGILARKVVDERKVTMTMKKLKLLGEGKEKDLALIDAVVVTESFIGARALWDLQRVKQVFLTRAEPGSIGLSSIGAVLRPLSVKDPFGLLIELGPGGEKVQAPIAPGLITAVEVKSYRVLEPGEKVLIALSPSIIALDGEREVEVNAPNYFELSLGMDGPRVGNIQKILREAIKKGLFGVDRKWSKRGSHGVKS
ncbi:MAG: NAD(+)/NADH kinase [Proteobacteria bacterium]|nr:NAD(+)/NADH kinase [Pseudomonadota bacterium]